MGASQRREKAEIDRELKRWAYECRIDAINAEEVLRANAFQLLLLASCPSMGELEADF
jgi:hypothetical protein